MKNEKVFVSHYNNVEELFEDGMDKEILDEKHYVYGKSSMKPSEIKEGFTIIEVEGSSDTPVFLDSQKEEMERYLEGN